jgi:SAM-dependent methyltransferase
MRLATLSSLLVLLILPLTSGNAHRLLAQAQPESLAPFVPTPEDVVEEMLKLAEVGKNDVVYDLGSGDGRIVITAAKKYGAKGVGFDIDEGLVKQAQENARKAGVADRVEFRVQDVMTVDLSPATVVTLYLLPESNLKLRPRLQSQLWPGARIVSHDFDMGDWEPAKTLKVKGYMQFHDDHTLFLWRIPSRRS